jgi:hypothetical protein
MPRRENERRPHPNLRLRRQLFQVGSFEDLALRSRSEPNRTSPAPFPRLAPALPVRAFYPNLAQQEKHAAARNKETR